MDYSYEYRDKLDYKHSRLSWWLEVMINSKNKILKPMSVPITKDPIFKEVLNLTDMSILNFNLANAALIGCGSHFIGRYG
ncbi:hypothetical protein AAEX37_01375 [Oligella sp. MSHR50489EDL]|uniref:hypothetical protein n=1 Tax=Oligella sp. MSHR50489EDL TaxID=3139409 RepID=UPI003D81AD13